MIVSPQAQIAVRGHRLLETIIDALVMAPRLKSALDVISWAEDKRGGLKKQECNVKCWIKEVTVVIVSPLLRHHTGDL